MGEGYVEVERTNIKVMGRDRVGKTCFADSLADKPFCPEQVSSDTVTVRTMITTTKPNVWCELEESGTTLYFDKAMAKGIVLQQQRLDQRPVEDETSVVPSTTAYDLSSPQRNEAVNDSGGLLSKFLSRLRNFFRRKEDNFSNPLVSGTQPQSTVPTDPSPTRPSVTELPFLSDDIIRIAAASLPDEAALHSLAEKLRSVPDLMQQEISLRVVKVWDFPGQPLFWSMLSGLIQTEPSPYSVTICMLLFKMSRLLSDCAQKPVFLDRQCGPLPQSLHWIEQEGDFIRYLLMAIRISQTALSEEPQVFEIGVLSPAVFAVATHADEEEAQENEKQQNEELTKLLEESGYDAHVVLPSKDSDVKFFKVDNTKSGILAGDENVREICNRVEEISSEFFKKGGKRRVPLRFMRLEKLIYKVVSILGRGLMKVEMLREVAKRLCHIQDEEFVVALKSLTNFAVLFYFPDVVQLNELVVISPQWLFNAMAAFASVEKPDPYLRPDWRKLKEEGIMTWRLAEYLLKNSGVQEDEYGGVLQLFLLIGIICPCLKNPGEITSPITAGTDLFVPSLMDDEKVESSVGVTVVDNPSPHLPPSVVFYPKNVDIFPEVLFFRFIAFLLSVFPIAPRLRRYEALFQLDHDLQLTVAYHACWYVTATLSSVNTKMDQSKITPYCFWLFQMMSETLHMAKHPGMAGFELDLCIHLPTINDDPTGRINTAKLVRVSDYAPDAPLVCRDGSRVSTSDCSTVFMWFTSCFSQMLKSHSAKSIIDAVLKHGATRWFVIGRELGYSANEVKSITREISEFEDKLLAIIEAKSTSVGENKALEDLLVACKNIPNPIFGAVGHELKAV